MEIRKICLIALQAVFVISWSSGFIGARMGTADAGPINLLFWRFFLVTVCLLPLVWHRLFSLSWERIRYNAIIGFLAQFCYLVSVYIAIRNGLPAGIAAIICALQPLIAAALTARSHLERSGRKEVVGLVIGFVGVGIVISGEYRLSSMGLSPVLFALPLISAFTLSVATLYQRRQALQSSIHARDGMILPLFLQSATTLFLLAAVALPLGELKPSTESSVWIAVGWLTLFSTLIAYLSLWHLLKGMSATRVSALVYLEPPVTLLWAAWWFGDVIHWTTYLGIIVIATAVLMTRWPLWRGTRIAGQ